MTTDHGLLDFFSLDAWVLFGDTRYRSTSPKEGTMNSNTSPVTQLWTSVRDELRDARAARAARKALEPALAGYPPRADRNDRGAILDRHSAEETADIRRILSVRLSA